MIKELDLSPDFNFASVARATPEFFCTDLNAMMTAAGTSSIKRTLTLATPEAVIKEIETETISDMSELKVLQSNFETALSYVQPSSRREGFTTVPNVTWEQIGALKWR
jgi:ribosome biogenesis ATPase